MEFNHFLKLILALYALYYLSLFLIERLTQRSLNISDASITEFVVPPGQNPINVHSLTNRELELEEKPIPEVLEEVATAPESAKQENILQENGDPTYDLGLETIVTTGGIPVASTKFGEWLKKFQ